MSFGVTERFVAARDAWFAARQRSHLEAMSRAEAPMASSASIQYALRRWSPRVRVPATRGVPGRVSVDPRLVQVLQATSDAVPQIVASEMDRLVGGLLFAAWRAWPVRTGLSKSLLDVSFEGVGGALVATVYQRAPYWPHVLLGGQAATQVLLARPGRAVRDEIGRRVTEILRGGSSSQAAGVA